jgi:hypothetical protein
VYHWDGLAYEDIARVNGEDMGVRDEYEHWHGVAGACPRCGNTHTNGLLVKKEDV